MRSATQQCAARLRARLSDLGSDCRGTVAIYFTIALPVLLMITGGALDYLQLVSEKSRAQNVADYASLAGAKELSLADRNKQNVPAVVDAVIAASMSANVASEGGKSYVTQTTIRDGAGAPLEVEVQLARTVKSNWGSQFGFGDTTVRVRSVAKVVGKPNLCLLALNPSSGDTIYLQKNATIVGENCAAYSNSTHSNGIKAYDSSNMTATLICSAGGKAVTKGNFVPEPLTDCPQFQDPLAGRPEPVAGGCTATNLVINNQTINLLEGTYCGGITIMGTSRVTLSPGVFTIKDGPLLVSDSATMTGQTVGLYFSGKTARFSFATGTTIDLTAPKTGPMAGLLMFGSRAQGPVRHEIFSDNARQLLGTIYLPTGELSIDANQPIADKSAYTAIVVDKLTANSGPTVTLNTNYDMTDIPVPEGIRGVGQPVALAR